MPRLFRCVPSEAAAISSGRNAQPDQPEPCLQKGSSWDGRHRRVAHRAIAWEWLRAGAWHLSSPEARSMFPALKLARPGQSISLLAQSRVHARLLHSCWIAPEAWERVLEILSARYGSCAKPPICLSVLCCPGMASGWCVCTGGPMADGSSECWNDSGRRGGTAVPVCPL